MTRPVQLVDAIGYFFRHMPAIFLVPFWLWVMWRCYKHHSQNQNMVAENKSGKKCEVKTYILHPKEWILSLFVLTLLIYLRTVHYTQGSWFYDDEWNDNVFEDDWDAGQVSRRVAAYCAVDLEMLCSNQGEEFRLKYNSDTECEQAYGPFLTRKLGISSYDELDPPASERLYKNKNGGTVQVKANAPSLLADVHKCGLDMQLQLHGWPPMQAFDLQYHIKNKTLLENKDSLSVARVVKKVLVAPQSFFTCANGAVNLFSYKQHPYGPYNTSPKDEDRAKLIEFYLEEMMEVFATDMAVENRLVATTWTRLEFLDIATAVARTSKHSLQLYQVLEKMTRQEEEASMEAAVDGTTPKRRRHLAYNTPAITDSSSSSVVVPTAHDITYKHEFHLFPCNHAVDQCMYSHFENSTLVTSECEKRMQQAQTKMRELLYCPLSSDFLVIVHMIFLGANFCWMLVLIQACSVRKRMKKRLDKKRRQLEQELNDPFLRESLEKKAQRLPAKDRERFFAGLEETIRTWDSSARATWQTKLWVRRMRFTILFVISLNFVFGLLLIKWQVESRAMLLESLIVGFLLFTLSYILRIPSAKEDASPETAAQTSETGTSQSPQEATIGLLDDIVKTTDPAPV